MSHVEKACTSVVPSLGGVEPNKKAGRPESFRTCTRCSLDLNSVRSRPSSPLSTREKGMGSMPRPAVDGFATGALLLLSMFLTCSVLVAKKWEMQYDHEVNATSCSRRG